MSESDNGNSSAGRRVDNMGPILMSPGGTFNIPQNKNVPGGFTRNVPPTSKATKSPSPVKPKEPPSPKEISPKEPPSGKEPSEENENNRLVPRELYGGSLSIQIPGSFQDVSTIREVRYETFSI